VKVFNWLGTTWGANIHYTTAMLNALAFVAMFVIGGLTGIFMAATPVDVFFHDTYFIVGHVHYVLFMSSIFGIFGAIYFWFPKMFGRMMNEPLGKVHFALTFLFSNGVFYPMHIIGLRGHPRRYFDSTGFSTWANIQWLNQFMTVCALLLGLAQIIFLVNFFWSLWWGQKAERNPWHSNTLEWAAPTPPPHGNFETPPIVNRGPYEYSPPDQAEDYVPQTAPVHGQPQPVPAH
jgi:cytochrome c oxidase subunit 1